MDNHEVVRKLIGPIEPIADTAVDSLRKKNLKEHIDLAQAMVADLVGVASYETSGYASMKELGKKARAALEEIIELSGGVSCRS